VRPRDEIAGSLNHEAEEVEQALQDLLVGDVDGPEARCRTVPVAALLEPIIAAVGVPSLEPVLEVRFDQGLVGFVRGYIVRSRSVRIHGGERSNAKNEANTFGSNRGVGD
jgi:hypothetical protein